MPASTAASASSASSASSGGSPSSPSSLPGALVFGSDDQPGIRRLGRTRFRYEHETGRRISLSDRERIGALVIPPAWTNVWISADANSHLQATGRDARNRKQYQYHDEFTNLRGAAKFGDLAAFAAGLGRLRRAVKRDLSGSSPDHDHVVAVLVQLLDMTSLRIGNEVYARTNKSFGLTTLRNRHVVIRGSEVRMRFRGKSAHQFDVTVDDKRLARLVRRCQSLPGQRLFEYVDGDGEVCPVGSTDVNDYIRQHGAERGSAKTFRTWGASVMAGELLAEASADDEEISARTVNAALRIVAGHLGNTLAVCRASYVHPAIIEHFLDGTLADRWTPSVHRSPNGLTVSERRLLRLLGPATH